ncbi:MAG TPA: hypothetical protein VEL74_05935 [Thermoanaerobaculia bacterium]|nr:hypothetical protein [Thermoanaerobaculia bacterium]
MTSIQARKAFVIGPIGDRDGDLGTIERLTWEDAVQVFEEIIEPALQANGFIAIRADKIARSGEIPEQIFRHLRDRELVIADLTAANPNVMYELGLRHTTGKLTIQIGERGRLPFDVAAIRTILFRRTEAGFVRARRDLTEAIEEGLAEGGDPVTATRIWFEQPAGQSSAPVKNSSSPAVAEGEEPEEEPGFLESLADAQEGWTAITSDLELVTSITQEIGAIMREGSSQVQKVNQQGGDSSAKLFVANRVAHQLDEPASRMEVAVGAYRLSMQRVDAGMSYIIQRLRDEPELRAGAERFIENTTKLAEVSAVSLAQAEGYRDSLKPLGEASRSLRRVANRISRSLDQFIEASQSIRRWREGLEGLQGPVA